MGFAKDQSTNRTRAEFILKFADDTAFANNKGVALAEGDIYYNTTTKTLRRYDGATWHSVLVYKKQERLTATATNVLPQLGKTPIPFGDPVTIHVGTLKQTQNHDFTMSGKTINWNAANAGFDIPNGYSVDVEYLTMED